MLFNFVLNTNLNSDRNSFRKKRNFKQNTNSISKLKSTNNKEYKNLLNITRSHYQSSEIFAENFLHEVSRLVISDFETLKNHNIKGITLEILKDMIHNDKDFGANITDEELEKKFVEYDVLDKGYLDKITYSGILSEFMLAKSALKKLNKFIDEPLNDFIQKNPNGDTNTIIDTHYNSNDNIQNIPNNINNNIIKENLKPKEVKEIQGLNENKEKPKNAPLPSPSALPLTKSLQNPENKIHSKISNPEIKTSKPKEQIESKHNKEKEKEKEEIKIANKNIQNNSEAETEIKSKNSNKSNINTPEKLTKTTLNLISNNDNNIKNNKIEEKNKYINPFENSIKSPIIKSNNNTNPNPDSYSSLKNNNNKNNSTKKYEPNVNKNNNIINSIISNITKITENVNNKLNNQNHNNSIDKNKTKEIPKRKLYTVIRSRGYNNDYTNKNYEEKNGSNEFYNNNNKNIDESFNYNYLSNSYTNTNTIPNSITNFNVVKPKIFKSNFNRKYSYMNPNNNIDNNKAEKRNKEIEWETIQYVTPVVTRNLN